MSSRSTNNKNKEKEVVEPVSGGKRASTKKDVSDDPLKKRKNADENPEALAKVLEHSSLGDAGVVEGNDVSRKLQSSFDDLKANEHSNDATDSSDESTVTVSSNQSLTHQRTEQEETAERLRIMEAALNMNPLTPFVSTPTQIQTNSVIAKLRVITVAEASAYMLVLLDHNYELRNVLIKGQPYVKPDGTEGTLPVNFCWLFYLDMYRALEDASEALKRVNLPKLILPAIQGFKTAATSGGIMVCTTSSRQEVDIALAALRELYARFVYSDDNPYYAGKKVTLEIREFRPKAHDSMVYRVLDKLCAEKNSA